MFDFVFTLWSAPIIIMAGVVMVGIIIHLATLPFLFVHAVYRRRGRAFVRENPVVLLTTVPMALFAMGWFT